MKEVNNSTNNNEVVDYKSTICIVHFLPPMYMGKNGELIPAKTFIPAKVKQAYINEKNKKMRKK